MCVEQKCHGIHCHIAQLPAAAPLQSLLMVELHTQWCMGKRWGLALQHDVSLTQVAQAALPIVHMLAAQLARIVREHATLELC